MVTIEPAGAAAADRLCSPLATAVLDVWCTPDEVLEVLRFAAEDRWPPGPLPPPPPLKLVNVVDIHGGLVVVLPLSGKFCELD